MYSLSTPIDKKRKVFSIRIKKTNEVHPLTGLRKIPMSKIGTIDMPRIAEINNDITEKMRRGTNEKLIIELKPR